MTSYIDPATTYIVRSYQHGSFLDGAPTAELVEASLAAAGMAVHAYIRAGVWNYIPSQDVDGFFGAVAVYVEEDSSRVVPLLDSIKKARRSGDSNQKPPSTAHDPINHPPHYTGGKVECIDAIEAQLSEAEFIGFLKGQVAKYIWRMGKKGSAEEDLAKALWYADRLGRRYSNASKESKR
jgi:hypothetical protein